MNMFENYYGKPQGNVNLYGFNLPLEYYNCLWKEDDKRLNYTVDAYPAHHWNGNEPLIKVEKL